MSLSVEEMNKQLPVANALPGEAVPYYMASGEGGRYEIDGQLVTVIARAADIGSSSAQPIFPAAWVRNRRSSPMRSNTRRCMFSTASSMSGFRGKAAS
jgi:hypothetical protein